MRLFFVTFLIFHYLFLDSNVESVPTAERKGSENQTIDEEQQLDQLRQPSENGKPDQDASGRKQKKNSIFQQNYLPKDYKRFSSIRFTPEDLAKYILKTGDEEGVTLAIEEMLREKMLNREEAISYLQEIKNVIMGLKNDFKNSIQANVKKNEKLEEPNINFFSTSEAPVVVSNTLVPTKSNERSKKKLNVRPKEFHNEDTLQHVIYQLAKDMFKYSLTFGDQSAKESLAELITFLEMEVENKQISPFVKKKILDIISAALIDSLKEYPELISQEKKMYNVKSNKENLYNSSKKQQIELSSRNEANKKIP